MAERRVVVQNGKTGEQYAVTPAAFRKHYEGAGFRILHWEGGEEFTEHPAAKPGKAASGETSAAKERRRKRAAARRAEKKAAAAVAPAGPQPVPEEE